MKELYIEPELQVVCFVSMQRIAMDIGGGEGDGTSGDKDGDLGMDI